MSVAGPTRLRWGLTVVLLGLLVIAVAQAASPVFWRVSTQAEFLEGEVENLSIDTTGQLRLGPESEVVYETTAPFLWSASEVDGVLWVGSGNDGRVFRVEDSDGGRTVFDADELNVHTVAAIDENTAYAGTSPAGAVFRVSATEEARQVFDPDEQYIWAMTSSGSLGDDLFVATGDPGRIYRVSPDGTATLFYDTNTTHVLSLAVDTDGNLLAGTGSPGRVFRISPGGVGFVVLDSPFSEIRTLRVAPDGVVYAVGVSQSPGQPQATTTTTQSSPTATVTASTSVSETTVTSANGSTPNGVSATAGAGPGPSASASGAVYRILPDGVWDVVWESRIDAPYDVAVAPPDSTAPGAGRSLLIGTGGAGRIFQVTENPRRVVLLARAPAQQVMQFVPRAQGGHHYVTANPGKVYRLLSDRESTGTYLSTVRDAETVATWGTVRWRASTPADTSVRLFTRTGNTAEPNDTWSPWSDGYTDSAGSQVTSPKARYLQWKAELSGTDASPVLFSVTTAYLPRNLAPEITTVTVHEPGVVFQQPFSGTDPPIAGLTDEAEARAANTNGTSEGQSNSLGRRVFRKGLQTFVWTARDGNQDELTFDVFYRTEAQSVWSSLAEELRASIFTWDTSSAPDGTYLFRVVATDTLSNPPGLAMRGAMESTPFDVDNSPPEVALDPIRAQDSGTIVGFVVSDAHSPIQRVEYSLDTERWQVVYPIDGIPDSRTERFAVTLEAGDGDRLVIRATDAMGNTITAAGTEEGRR